MWNDSHSSRRGFLARSLGLAVAPPLLGPAAVAKALHPPEDSKRPLKVVCVGAHPDDPESGCGGTLAKYAAAGHRVTIVYLTRGERGIEGKSLDEAAAIRTAEAETACKLLGARPVFAGQIDGATEMNRARIEAMASLLAGERPDVVFAHWPVDAHMDHQIAGALTYQAWLRSPAGFSLYFFEVETGDQTMGFNPTHYVDIAASREKKLAALFAHKSQDGEAIYRDYHKLMEEVRGREAGMRAAEAFVRLPRDARSDRLPES